jgi:hypothetical protein
MTLSSVRLGGVDAMAEQATQRWTRRVGDLSLCSARAAPIYLAVASRGGARRARERRKGVGAVGEGGGPGKRTNG